MHISVWEGLKPSQARNFTQDDKVDGQPLPVTFSSGGPYVHFGLDR